MIDLWTLIMTLVMLAFMDANYERATSLDIGWAERWQAWSAYLETQSPKGSQPWWDGKPVDTLCVYYETGWGDKFQFGRYSKVAKTRCKKLIVSDKREPADAYSSMMSLPYALGLHDPVDSPRPPYIEVNPLRLTELWRRELSSISGYRVGICWQGDPTRPSEPERSIPLSAFLPLREVPGVTLISVQKGFGVTQLHGVSGIANLDSVMDTGKWPPFSDACAVIQNLDLVITSDTAIAHLAGALDRPVWLALHVRPDWRWGIQGETTPWYPSMRLFRQSRLGDWGSVFQKIANELRARYVRLE